MLEAKSVIGGQGVRDDTRMEPLPSLDASSAPDDRRRDGRQPFKIQTCRFFLQGTCKKGEKCTYLHGGETPRERGPPRERRPSESEWSAGDWECRKCGQHNFSKRATCFRCEAEKGSPDRRGPPPSRGIRQAEDELREAEILLKTAQGEGNAKNISLAEEAIGRAMLAVKRAREPDDEERRDRRGPPRDYRRRSRSPPRYGFRDRSPPRDFRDRSPPRGYRDRWGSDRGGWGPDQGPSWGGPPGLYPPHGSASYPSGGRPPPDLSYDSAAQGRWEETVAPNGDKYFWHTVTKETSWTDPRVTAPPAPAPPVPVALNWEVAIDEHGDKYYWHTVTGATQWEPPPGFVDKSKVPAPAATTVPQQYPPRLNAPTTSSLKGSQASRGVQRLG